MGRRRVAALLAAWVLTSLACRKDPNAADAERSAERRRIQAEGLYVRAQSESLAGHHETAHKLFDELQSVRPEDPRLPSALGELFLSEGKLREAKAQFTEAVKRDPGRATNWSRLGDVLSRLGETQAAEDALRQALQRDPREVNAWAGWGELRLQEKDVDGGVAALVNAAELAAGPAQELYWLRAYQALKGQHRWEEAATVLESAVDAGAGTVGLRQELAELLVEQGRLSEALPWFEQLARSQKDPLLWLTLGELYLRFGRLTEAEAAFRESGRQQHSALALLGLARTHLRRKDLALATTAVEEALAAATGEAHETVALAEVLEAVRRPADAVRLLQTLVQEEGMGVLDRERAVAASARLGAATLVRQLCAGGTDGGQTVAGCSVR